MYSTGDRAKFCVTISFANVAELLLTLSELSSSPQTPIFSITRAYMQRNLQFSIPYCQTSHRTAIQPKRPSAKLDDPKGSI